MRGLALVPLLLLACPSPGNTGDVWATTPGSGSLVQRHSKTEETGRELEKKLSDDEAMARRYVRQGMGVEEVRQLMGEPRGMAVSAYGGRYLCLGYGRVWVVFEDGQTSCLRSRLEYVARYDSDCHCAGNALSLIPFAKP